jgi:two-component system, OmpR family, phosphate regulon sensor histidine kinase PhoR
MAATLLSDLSLYELAIQSDLPPVVSQMNPATFKSAVVSLIDRLVEKRINAIVWARLPKGDSWQAELDRYGLLPGIPKAVYNFKLLKDDSKEDQGDDSAELSGDRSQDLTAANPLSVRRTALNSNTPVVPIPLESSNLLRREYFLMIWSTDFQATILAHRPRSTAAETATDDTPDKKALLTFLSFDPGLIRELIGGLEHALPASTSQSLSDVSVPVLHWQKLLADTPAQAPDIHAIGSWATRQLQRQDEVWQRYAACRKQSESTELLQRQNQELVNSVRLKDDFLSSVGKELRTPLTTIKTALSLINSPNLKPPQRQRYMDLIAKECDRQSSLITSLLDLVQLDQTAGQTTVESINLCESVPGFVSIYQPLAEEKGIMMAYTIPEDLPPVACAPTWLRQIVINLLHNGIKFTPGGGQVWVKAKPQGDYIQIEFRDTGIGIAPHEIPKIFDRFYRIRQATEENTGAGLGLTIVQQLLLYCGGSISVKSRVGEGSTFNVLLPVHRPNDSD